MIRHCVFVKFRAEVTAAQKQAVYDNLNGLRDTIPGMVDAVFGANVSPEGKSKGYDDGFTMDFENAVARDVYLEDPGHKAAAGEMVALLEGGGESVLVFDLEI
jgi:hypothetical protein